MWNLNYGVALNIRPTLLPQRYDSDGVTATVSTPDQANGVIIVGELGSGSTGAAE